MFWIKDRDGGLCNLARASDVRCCPPLALSQVWEVRADFGSHQIVLFTGKREECGAYRDHLFEKLQDVQTNWAD